MIYLPHPKFDFEEARHLMVGNCNSFPIDAKKIIKRFPEAKSDYWEYARHYGPSYCFVREDGAEFAIRFIRNYDLYYGDDLCYGDVIGYFKDLTTESFYQEYVKFLNYLLGKS